MQISTSSARLTQNTNDAAKNSRSRYLVALLASSGLAIIYGLKVNMSMVLVAMVKDNPPKVALLNGTLMGREVSGIIDKYVFSQLPQCDVYEEGEGNSQLKNDMGPFTWSPREQGQVLGAYFWGYMLSQLPGGRLAETYGAKWVLFWSVAVNIVATLLTPAAAWWSINALIVLRAVEGVAGGATFPATHVLLAKWAPIDERSFMSSMVYTGTCLGTVASLLGAGIIADYFGWAAVFYVMGLISLPWLPLWACFVTNSPDQDMSMDEMELVMRQQKRPVPWKAILTSRPYQAVVLAHCLNNWGWYLFLTQTPHYIATVLHYSLTESAVLSSIPFLLMLLFSLALSSVLDKRRLSDSITNTQIRKLSTVVSSLCPALCLSLLLLFSCERDVSVALLATAITTSGGMFSGFLANHIDLAGNYAGTLMAVSNTFASVSGIAITYHVGAVTTGDNPNINMWRVIFLETIILYILEAAIYVSFASGEEQPWNKDESEKSEKIPLKEEQQSYESLLVH